MKKWKKKAWRQGKRARRGITKGMTVKFARWVKEVIASPDFVNSMVSQIFASAVLPQLVNRPFEEQAAKILDAHVVWKKDSPVLVCDLCGCQFQSEATEEEATAELEREFPGVHKSECSVLCDDCYRRSITRIRAERN